MTDQSRVEAVARAIAVFVGNDPDARQLGRKESPLLWELHKSCAQAAIEANDAWLAERGWKPVPRSPTAAMIDATRQWVAEQWAYSWDEAPSPEEPAQ